jgi:hypothetical protein
VILRVSMAPVAAGWGSAISEDMFRKTTLERVLSTRPGADVLRPPS